MERSSRAAVSAFCSLRFSRRSVLRRAHGEGGMGRMGGWHGEDGTERMGGWHGEGDTLLGHLISSPDRM